MIYLIGRMIIYAIIFLAISAFVVLFYRVILSFHEEIMNDTNDNDDAQVQNSDE